ncbi:MAG: N-acetylglucosamine-6-phosphate deacetylase [Pseudopedobacter saltans]|uniref:N-acetylglucosamine-6-phosphate deacetylase n=1 Tax=Pseudopedobacter saltans TaxID=151895 RepID=A0A2W5ES44_9SPHI|nr:MAG: N-acetylglucosamine-6-phosphate deacetylase [Pseudopedobacter saltans]
MSRQLYAASKIFTGEQLLKDHAIEVENNIIINVQPVDHYPDFPMDNFYTDALIVPAFIDIQLYGAFGRLLSVFPDKETVSAIYEYSKNGGAAYCIPTVATNSYPVFFRCIDVIRDYWNSGGKGVMGLHIEGPWISEAKKGAHISKYIFSPTIQQVNELLDYGKDVVKIITLAPEVVDPEVIQYIQMQGIVISAGHSNANYKKATQVFNDCNIPTATHLYNAMSPLLHREPGIVGAIFDDEKIMASIVPDGHHVDFAAIRIAKKIMKNRLFAITDAVTETNIGDYPHHLDNDKYIANGILSGSALTMEKCLQNLVREVGIDLEEALRMCSFYPAQAIGKSTILGKIAVGYKAKLTLLNNNIEVVTVLDEESDKYS